MLKLEPQENGEFKVYYDNGVYMGDISRAHDFNYNFWPDHPSKGGFWPAHCLQDIVNELNKLNKPLEDEFNQWCEDNPPGTEYQ